MKTAVKQVIETQAPEAPVSQPGLVRQRFDQAIERASAAIRELRAAAAGAVMTVEPKEAADYLGVVKAQSATLEALDKELKAILIATGEASVSGELFKATISRFNRDVLDMEAVREKLSPQFITAHTTQTPITSVKVTARNTL